MSEGKKSKAVPIPIPEDFPFSWEDPADAELTWMWEKTHCPESVPVLAQDFWIHVFDGISTAAEYYGEPGRMVARRINSYIYFAERMVVDADEIEAAKERAKEAGLAAAPKLKAMWNDEMLPEIQGYIRRWDDFDLEGASAPDLLRHVEESWEWLQRVWVLHFQLGHPMWLAQDSFSDLYRELFEAEGEEKGEVEKAADPFERLKLIQGIASKTTEMGLALWKLGESMSASVRELLISAQPAAAIETLEAVEEGRSFLAELANFLEEYGHRGNHWGPQYATWIEDPTPVIEILQGYLADADADPERDFAVRAAEREEAVAEIRRRLLGYPSSVRDRFEELLERAQFCAALKEDHNFWMDFSCTSRVRRVMRVAGQHLVAAGAIDAVDDVFHLHLSEVVESLSGAANGDKVVVASIRDRRSLVARRRAEIEHFAAIEPPPQLGVEPPPPKNEKPKPVDEPGILRGQPGAPGVVRGRARIVERPSAARHLAAGDILVTVSTSPSFTPLFATVAGVVTEAGGLLSHCATVAREYRIAAVVGLDHACRLLTDGQWIEIDGEQGTVRLVDADESRAADRE